MTFLINCIKGIAIGAGAILPGISSGVLCVIFGIYEKLLNSILGFFKNIKENIKFLSPIILGGFLGVLLFSNILNYLFASFPIQIKGIFVGLILGSIPSLLKDVRKKENINNINRKYKSYYIIYTIIAFCIGLFSVFLEEHLSISISNNINSIYLILCGFLMSIGVIIPRC